jgi:hypothetical protein
MTFKKKQKQLGTKTISVEVPIDLADTFGKLCIDRGVTRTQAIIKYLKYLKAIYYKHREFLDEESKKESFLLNQPSAMDEDDD